MAPKRKEMEYYAIVKGRISKPTIFSSWGDAHPRVTGCAAVHKSFATIEEAREYMKEKKELNWTEIIKDGAGSTTPRWGSYAFYAVANGRHPGVYKYFHGEGGSEPKITEVPGACHKRFRTQDQAQAFIEDWKQALADVYREAIKTALDKGFRPSDLKLSVESFLYETQRESEGADILQEMRVDKLNLEEK